MADIKKDVNEVEVEETQKETFFTKAGNFVKRNGKKIVAVVAAVGVTGAVAYLLGKNSTEVDYEPEAETPDEYFDEEDSVEEL